MVGLHEFGGKIGRRPNRKRVGRGVGSGLGKTAGYGSKGAGSRSGRHSKRGFAGGQKPLYRQVAKRGFVGPPSDVVEVTVKMIAVNCTGEVSRATLLALTNGRPTTTVRVVGAGDCTGLKSVEANYFTAGAQACLTSNGVTAVQVR